MNTSGYFRVAASVPVVKPAAVRKNTDAIINSFMECCEQGASVVLFPELSITGYSCGDLFFQSRLLDSAENALMHIIEATSARASVLIIGMPLARSGRIFNVAVVVRGGTEILGIVPKTYIPNSQEYYENRWFASADEAPFNTVNIGGQDVPFGTDLLFCHKANTKTTFAVEICEDLWSPIPPSSHHTMAGAQVIFNPSASSELVGKADYRRQLVAQQSARCLSAYVYTSAGPGESTTDSVFGGHALIAENGKILSESTRFPVALDMVLADLDIDLLDHERRTSRTFGPSLRRESSGHQYRSIYFGGRLHVKRDERQTMLRPSDPYPFIPKNTTDRNAYCQDITSIQATGLAVRLSHAELNTVVIGLSGGLDSTLALLIAVLAFQRLSLPLQGIHALTLPGFGTTKRTLHNVKKLCEGFEIPLDTVDIRENCRAELRDLGHSGKPEDPAYENVQARYRTAFLMNRANMVGGLLLGTGDLSELALGWCTYNGDHMSMYSVNAGVPKTLVRFLVAWLAEKWASATVKQVLEDILQTPISPELLPPDSTGQIIQKTEETIGPYALHDFFLFHAIRHGFTPCKIFEMAQTAFIDVYNPQTILKWLRLFYERFFSQQFKRSCLPDGPKVGSIALSPRGDWRMPSDADAEIWLTELSELSFP